MRSRHITFLIGEDYWLSTQLSSLFQSFQFSQNKSAVLFFDENIEPLSCLNFIKKVPFSKARNQLGQEYDLIIYDGRVSFNLDAFAIAIGTLRSGGILCMLFHHWEKLADQIDLDSQRWSGISQGIRTPNFIYFFQNLVKKYAFPLYRQDNNESFELLSNFFDDRPELDDNCFVATQDQQAILTQILASNKDIHVLTAKRGRGKSALAGLLAERLEQVIVTAPNKSAVKILQAFSHKPLEFIAPDELARLLVQDPDKFAKTWLIIDEAAMLPLPLLQQLTQGFFRILCTTTTQSYEGTGRGFLLKFIQKNYRTLQCFELTEPLRWRADDPLEAFIDELLLLEAEESLSQCDFQLDHHIKFWHKNNSALFEQDDYRDFYGLLTLAHYKTSPVDLRRLFDGIAQQFLLAKGENSLVGGVWTLEEGELQDNHLISDIMRGIRRPKGNLVAQMLCQYSLQPKACTLSSSRISRIAVQPKWQNHGLGQRLVEQLSEKTERDFLSVSFGYSIELANFWRKCGFDLVYIGEHKEASSGCYTAIAVKGLTISGKMFCAEALRQFQRNITLSFHPFAAQLSQNEVDWTITEWDKTALTYFAYHQRNLASTIPSIRRLLNKIETHHALLLAKYCKERVIPEKNKKAWLQACRQEVKSLLPYIE